MWFDQELLPLFVVGQRPEISHPIQEDDSTQVIVGMLNDSRVLAFGLEIDRLPRFIDTSDTDYWVTGDKTKNLWDRKTVLPVVYEVTVLGLDHRIDHDLQRQIRGGRVLPLRAKDQHLQSSANLGCSNTASSGRLQRCLEGLDQLVEVPSSELVQVDRLGMSSQRRMAESNDGASQVRSSLSESTEPSL